MARGYWGFGILAGFDRFLAGLYFKNLAGSIQSCLGADSHYPDTGVCRLERKRFAINFFRFEPRRCCVAGLYCGRAY